MNAPFDPTFMVNEKFAVGQPVSRKEDPVMLRGEGRYTDDLNLAGQLYGVMVRSRMAHGEMRSIDTDAAREMPGVHMIVTAADLDAAGIKNMQAAAGKHRCPGLGLHPCQKTVCLRPMAAVRLECALGHNTALLISLKFLPEGKL